MQPLVSVICLCYNHARFLREALDSVMQQTYPNLEILVVDDASTDNSATLLKQYQEKHPEIKLILHAQNTGNCQAFNEAFALSTGDYIIDFATDDVLLPNRISEQVRAFTQLDKTYGVIYTDAELIDEESRFIRNFYRRNAKGEVREELPRGDVFAAILSRTFLCPPTTIFRREVYAALNGYDATLAYEDFDFWVRASRQYKFFFLDQITTRRRLHPNSLSRQAYQPQDLQLASTVKVCVKALKLIRTENEKQALITRVRSELRQAYFTQNFTEANNLFILLQQLENLAWPYQLLHWLNHRKIKLGFIRDIYYGLYHRI